MNRTHGISTPVLIISTETVIYGFSNGFLNLDLRYSFRSSFSEIIDSAYFGLELPSSLNKVYYIFTQILHRFLPNSFALFN
ncbi:MAG TPA: hypothetical protein PLE30_10595 [Candidatus Kapabacteria bacterium]|nr:hypothetical protein [Candidatus Kapabacteria bacterium]